MPLLMEPPPQENQDWHLDQDETPLVLKRHLMSTPRDMIETDIPHVPFPDERDVLTTFDAYAAKVVAKVVFRFSITNARTQTAPEHPYNDLDMVNPECAERLRLLADLEPNWDGYGANTIARSALESCASLLFQLFRNTDHHSHQLFIAPLANGGIELEWDWQSGNELMLVIPPSHDAIEYLATTVELSSGQETEFEGVITNEASLEQLLYTLSD